MKHGDTGNSRHDPKDKPATRLERRPSTSDDVRLRMEIYTGNDYSG